MQKGVVVLLFLILLVQLVYSISIKELISRYNFSTSTPQINVTGYSDFMIDEDDDGVDDTLVFELTTNNAHGNFVFVISLFDKDGILTNEKNATLNAGINKLNVTFDSIFLTQNQFNYSIKIYNSSHSLKYRKDSIQTQTYENYEDGFRILEIKDLKDGKALKISITLNSSINGTFAVTLFLAYNNSIISFKEDKTITNSVNYLLFNFDNETIKRTHYTGEFNLTSIKIGKKMIKTDYATNHYDFRDFAIGSYIAGFGDIGVDLDSNGRYDILQIKTNLEVLEEDQYNIILAVYDLFNNFIELKDVSNILNSGSNEMNININGSIVYNKKLDGPFIVKNAELYKNNSLIDKVNDAYTTKNYNFNDFDGPNMPDLIINISASDEYRYGISNISVNATIENIGDKAAFNIFTEIFDNGTFFRSNKSSTLNVNSRIAYQFNFTGISDFEISAIADLQDFVEELNESNNAEKVVIKINKKPSLAPINNATANETDEIAINLSASDPNGDKLSFSINFSKFSNKSNIFIWNTAINDSGNYFLAATASDGFLNDTVLFEITILDISENDADKDGIDDSIDKLIGNPGFVNTSTINLTILVNRINNLSKLFNGNLSVKFIDGNLTVTEFYFDFSHYRLNLTNVAIDKQSTNDKGSLLIAGLKIPNTTKIMHIDNLNEKMRSVCIKDAQISSIKEISKNCNKRDEMRLRCDGKIKKFKKKSYRCAYNSASNKYKVEGLLHSGITQIR